MRISVHTSIKNPAKDKICFTFYGEDANKMFLNHGIVPYIVENKIVFTINDLSGYSFVKKKNENGYGSFSSSDDGLFQVCNRRLGGYIMEYDKESNFYYIDLTQRVERG